MTAFARALRENETVAAVVMETQLAAGGGKSSAIAIRAVERAFSADPAGIVFHTVAPSDENLERVMKWLKRSVHCPRSADDPAGEGSMASLVEAIRRVRGE